MYNVDIILAYLGVGFSIAFVCKVCKLFCEIVFSAFTRGN